MRTFAWRVIRALARNGLGLIGFVQRAFARLAGRLIGRTWAEVSEAEPLTPEQEESLRTLGLEQAARDLAEYREDLAAYEAYLAAPAAALGAFHLGELELARRLAERALALAASYSDDWNYGNATHKAHTALGLVALARNDLETAVAELHEAGRTRGSPQLNSFGPSMQLAKALLLRGERQSVLEYLEQCRSFWLMGQIALDIWAKKIRSGSVPVFFHHAF